MPPLVKRLLAFAVSAIVVHLIYIGIILPGSESAIALAQNQGLQSVPRNLFVILKDIEQEICIILMFWGIYLMVEKWFSIIKDKYLFGEDLLRISEIAHDDKIETLRAVRKNLTNLPDSVVRTPLVKTIVLSVDHFLITKDVHNTSETIDSNVEALAVGIEGENSMIRYLIWAIPSIGFIGTVRGIGQALSQADQALAGDIAGMTSSLSVAFNSTFVALIISIFLMFLLHELQRMQDALVVNIRAYCQKHIMEHISQ